MVPLKLSKLISTLTISLGCLAASLAQADSVSYEGGSFSDVLVEGTGCDDVFTVTEIDSRHFTGGPHDMYSVLYMFDPDFDPDDPASVPGFFHSARFMTHHGPDCDVVYEEELARDGVLYAVIAEGYTTQSFVLLDFEVQRLQSDGAAICSAKASYFAAAPER